MVRKKSFNCKCTGFTLQTLLQFLLWVLQTNQGSENKNENKNIKLFLWNLTIIRYFIPAINNSENQRCKIKGALECDGWNGLSFSILPASVKINQNQKEISAFHISTSNLLHFFNCVCGCSLCFSPKWLCDWNSSSFSCILMGLRTKYSLWNLLIENKYLYSKPPTFPLALYALRIQKWTLQWVST